MQLCDFQAVLCTEDEKKIRHLDTLYEVTMYYMYMKSLNCYDTQHIEDTKYR